MECIVVGIQEKKIVPRGFLIGPYCPIYGVGALFILLFLKKYADDVVVLFFMSCIMGATLEYLTSFIMEKIFKTRWWDYTNEKFNINGRICLKTTWAFGVLGVLLVRIIDPLIVNMLHLLPNFVINLLFIILVLIFIADVIVSFNIIFNIRRVAKPIYKDTTEEITEKVKAILKERSFLNKRLVNAFPDFKIDLPNIIKIKK